MTTLSCAVVVLSWVGVALGQGLFDCKFEGRNLAENAVVTAENCVQVTCDRGSIQRKLCDQVPFGCSVVRQDSGANYPDCCPRWCCGQQCRTGPGADGDFPGGSGLRPATGGGSRRTGPGADGDFPGGSGLRPATGGGSRRTGPGADGDFPGGSGLRPATGGGATLGGGSGGEVGAGSCSQDGRRIRNGQSASATGCKRLDCKDGVLTTHFCQKVPAGCTKTHEDTSKSFPGCCPVWRCRDGGSGSTFRPSGGSGRDCVHKDMRISHGRSVSAAGCRRLDCDDGVLTTRFCTKAPAGCRTVREDSSKPYPDCCPMFRC